PSHADLDARIFQLLGSLGGVFLQNLRNSVGKVVTPGIRFLPERFNLLQFLLAQFVDILVEGQRNPCAEFSTGVALPRPRLAPTARDRGNSDYKQADARPLG